MLVNRADLVVISIVKTPHCQCRFFSWLCILLLQDLQVKDIRSETSPASDPVSHRELSQYYTWIATAMCMTTEIHNLVHIFLE